MQGLSGIISYGCWLFDVWKWKYFMSPEKPKSKLLDGLRFQVLNNGKLMRLREISM